MNDFRIEVGFFAHPKTVKLRRRLGSEGVESLLQLWEYCSIPGNGRTDGNLSGMTNEDIAIAAKWIGDENDFVRSLAEIRFIDGKEGSWQIHKWETHNPYAAGHKERSIAGQKSVHLRWVREKRQHKKTPWCTDKCVLTENDQDTAGIPAVYGPDTTRIRDVKNGNTPYPVPVPVPVPVPAPVPEPAPEPTIQGRESRKRDSRESEIRRVFDFYRRYHPKSHPRPRSTGKEWRAIRARLDEGHTVEDLCMAIDGIHFSPFHQGENDRGKKYDSLELCMRDGSHVQQFIEVADSGPNPVINEKERRGMRAAKGFVERMDEIEERKKANAAQGRETIYDRNGNAL